MISADKRQTYFSYSLQECIPHECINLRDMNTFICRIGPKSGPVFGVPFIRIRMLIHLACLNVLIYRCLDIEFCRPHERDRQHVRHNSSVPLLLRRSRLEQVGQI
jgi:hypothetical protein